MEEVKDKSAYGLISVRDTGHPGDICTVHAHSVEVINRLAQQVSPGFDFKEEIECMVGCVVLKVAQANKHVI